MVDFPLKPSGSGGRKEAGPKALVAPTTPRHETPVQEVNGMPFEHDIGDSTPENNPEQFPKISDMVASFKRKFEWAVASNNEELAESYHRRIIMWETLLRELGE